MLPTLQVWFAHFKYHAERRCHIPDGIGTRSSPAERDRIAQSIAMFQLGAHCDGPGLLRAAQRYEQRHDAAPLAEIIQLLIDEEQHHSALLHAFMNEHGIPFRQRRWSKRVIRCLCRFAGFEAQVSVLITSKLIAHVFYRALATAAKCRKLKALCHILVADELAHVGFESELLLAMRARRSTLARLFLSVTHRAFLLAVSVIVWIKYRAVLKQPGYRFRTFASACLTQYEFYLGSTCGVSTISA